MTPGHDYESFILSAFGYQSKMGPISRGNDPAGRGDADLFNRANFLEAKAAVAYATMIFTKAVTDKLAQSGSPTAEAEIKTINGFLRKLMSTRNLGQLSTFIKDFNQQVIQQYFNVQNGRHTLK